MSAVSITYFCAGKECLGLSTAIAYPVGIVAAVVFFAIFMVAAKKNQAVVSK